MSGQRGHFIVIEGLEGAGKSTALKTIKKYLIENKIDLIVTREPGGTVAGEAIRHILKDASQSEPLDARAELLLFYAARVQLLQQVIRPALAKGTSVLADRFELSSFAYQGGGRQLDEKMLQALSKFCVDELVPSLILFLDVSPEQGLQRALGRGKLDRIEQESYEFFQRVYQAYHKHMKTMTNVVIIDANKPLVVVQNDIRLTLQRYFKDRSPNHVTTQIN